MRVNAEPNDAPNIIRIRGREKSYFSPIVSTPQKSMWMNGAADRTSLLGSPATTSTFDQKKLEDQARFKADGLHDYNMGGHVDFYNQASNDATATSAKDGLITTSNGSTPAISSNGSNSSSSSGHNNNNNIWKR